MNQAEYCLLWINWWPLCMQKAEWAAWAQAVFSVGAIFVAIAVPAALHRAARVDADRAEQIEVLKFTTVALVLANQTKGFLVDALKQISNLPDDEQATGRLTLARHLGQMVVEMRALPREMLPGPSAVKPWMVATHAVDNVVLRAELGHPLGVTASFAVDKLVAVDATFTALRDELRKRIGQKVDAVQENTGS